MCVLSSAFAVSDLRSLVNVVCDVDSSLVSDPDLFIC